MNALSLPKCKEFEHGFLGERNYHFQINGLKTRSFKFSLDMAHLGLDKPANYVGHRNLKQFTSSLSFKNRNNKFTSVITPYAQQDCQLTYESKIGTPKANGKSSFVFQVANVSDSEIRQSNKLFLGIGGAFKHPYFRTQLTLNCDDTLDTYGMEGNISLFNNKQWYKQCKSPLNYQNKNSQQEEESQSLKLLDSNANDNTLETQEKSESQKNEPPKQSFPMNIELSLLFKTIKFDTMSYSVYLDLLYKKLETIFSANFNGKSMKEIAFILKYNSSVSLRVTNKTSKEGEGGVELVYQHCFNEHIKLRNYINSGYTIATQLAYIPMKNLTLIYSANVNIKKFKQDVEDYKVGYGIYLNL